jgi:pyrroline-5-carboxylate reductase
MSGMETVGLVGAGALADALVGGLLAAGLPPHRLWVAYRSPGPRVERFRAAGLHVTQDKAEVAAAARTLVLLVKPADAAAALAELRDLVRPDHRILSCMAGVSTAYIEGALGGQRTRVLRAMPNLGAAVGASATALAAGRFADAEDRQAARELLAALGDVVEVDEDLMDAVTAVAGSGPAYVYYLMEALGDAARALDLPAAVARRLILQTVFGAAKLALESGRPPADLRQAVSSPGGTTVAALEVLEACGFRGAVEAAVRRAAQRSRELGRQWGPSP